ncbi:hypothetical protein DOTSEDRAFT_41561 [Dothistroma septosporum NZE10]|uniref:Allergen n=1 Tax=Dothistroma septosporum (strain NZE10 / CBS 128990) TaxID=675120 RepID=N1PVT1_DOTSN|nr:hypothetical protein DOTSEDRAFT_41561 [Dothistroma septosporum NZE10]
MDAATSAVSKLLYGKSGEKAEATPPPPAASNDDVPDRANDTDSSGAGQKDTTIEQEVAPAVEHETVKKEHETREQTVIDRERHQHHYHTTVQPLKDREVEATEHVHEQAATQERVIDKDDEGDQIKARVDAREGAFSDKTVEAATKETKTDEGEVVGEQVHHHLHETIQPVIEKETIVPSVTHKTIPVHEVINEATKDHGVTKKEAISVDEFKHNLDGEASTKIKTDGAEVDI